MGHGTVELVLVYGYSGIGKSPVVNELHRQGCVSELRRLGIEPNSVTYVLQSHLHLDHTGAIGRFPNAVHVVQRAEYEYAFTPDWFAAGSYIRNDFDKPALRWMFLEGFATDFYDLFGDGTIRLIFTPGHSVGHQSFLINLLKSPPMLLTADAAYTLDHWNEKALPGFLTSTIERGLRGAPSSAFHDRLNSTSLSNRVLGAHGCAKYRNQATSQ